MTLESGGGDERFQDLHFVDIESGEFDCSSMNEQRNRTLVNDPLGAAAASDLESQLPLLSP
jgi:hypothetical protein